MRGDYVKPAIKVRFVGNEVLLAASDPVVGVKTTNYEDNNNLILNAKTGNSSIWNDDDDLHGGIDWDEE